MTTKHTPGPWFYTWLSDENSGNPDYIHISAPSVLGTAGVCDLPMFRYGNLPPALVNQQREANARLIASAPELLEASNNLMAILEAYSNRTNDKKTKANSDWAMEILAAKDSMYRAIAKAEGRE